MNFDDPRITAYALNELEGDDKIQFEKDLALDPRLKSQVAEIGLIAGQLTAAFQDEPGLHLSPAQKEKVIRVVETRERNRDETSKIIGWWTWGATAVAMAACLALAFVLFGRPKPAPTQDGLTVRNFQSTQEPSMSNAKQSGNGIKVVPAKRMPMANRASQTAVEMEELLTQLPGPVEIASPTNTTQIESNRVDQVETANETEPVESPAPVEPPQVTRTWAMLPLKLPIPAFMGTPTDIVMTEHLEKPSDKPRAAFMAPKGVVNVAEKKKVTSSDPSPVVGSPDLITDGDKESSDDSYVELHRKLQWVQIDLEARAAIYAIVVWHSHNTPQVYHDVVVQVADDPDFKRNVQTVYNNDYNNSAGLGIGKDKEYFENYEGRLMDAKGVQGRYVRLYSSGSTFSALNRYTEVEVYGLPAGQQ